MNSAAVHSSKLIAEFENQPQQHLLPQYPSQHPFGASTHGPFGGASATDDNRQHSDDAFSAHNEMGNGADSDAANAAPNPHELAHHSAPGPSASHQPRALTQYDYPGGWGAQTFNGLGGLTQDSASRVATLQAKLNQRLGPEYLSQRPGPGGGKKLTYIEGWKLVDLANEVFGFNGWSTTIVRLDVDFLDGSPDGTRFNAGVSCVVRVTLRDGAFHEDIGYGSAENARQKHAALEKGKKEAVTDATKRALKNFGKLLGNCTYDHQYSANALKVSNPTPKFDASELHRRPELRHPQPSAPTPPPPPPPKSAPVQLQPAQAQPPRPPLAPTKPTDAPAPQQASSSSVQPALTAPDPSASTVRPPAPPLQSVGAPQLAAATTTPFASGSTTAPLIVSHNAASKPDKQNTNHAFKDEVAERQQRSMLARQAYLQRQQAEARKIHTHAPAPESHQIVTVAIGAQNAGAAAAAAAAAGQVEFGSDSFDDSFNEVLADYDETSMGDAEAASRALEMEIDEAHRQLSPAEHEDLDDTSSVLHSNYNAADDSGVALSDSSNAVQVKQEKVKAIEMRRSASPVKQVKMEAAKAPRRAGSVGRFVSPPPLPRPAFKTSASLAPGSAGYVSGNNVMRNGTTSLSAASMGVGASRNAGALPCRRMHSTTLQGMGGVEGGAANTTAARQPTREPVDDARVADDTLRGVKRSSEAVDFETSVSTRSAMAPTSAANAFRRL